jgi:hypothetical protein
MKDATSASQFAALPYPWAASFTCARDRREEGRDSGKSVAAGIFTTRCGTVEKEWHRWREVCNGFSGDEKPRMEVEKAAYEKEYP